MDAHDGGPGAGERQLERRRMCAPSIPARRIRRSTRSRPARRDARRPIGPARAGMDRRGALSQDTGERAVAWRAALQRLEPARETPSTCISQRRRCPARARSCPTAYDEYGGRDLGMETPSFRPTRTGPSAQVSRNPGGIQGSQCACMCGRHPRSGFLPPTPGRLRPPSPRSPTKDRSRLAGQTRPELSLSDATLVSIASLTDTKVGQPAANLVGEPKLDAGLSRDRLVPIPEAPHLAGLSVQPA